MNISAIENKSPDLLQRWLDHPVIINEIIVIRFIQCPINPSANLRHNFEMSVSRNPLGKEVVVRVLVMSGFAGIGLAPDTDFMNRSYASILSRFTYNRARLETTLILVRKR